MFWLIAALIVVCGTAVGWVSAWLVHRYDEDPATDMAVLVDATCTACGAVLTPLATAGSAGTCARCGTRLAGGWFAVTAAVPILGLGLLAAEGPHLRMVPFLWLVPVAVVAAAVDLRLMLVPRRVVWIGFGVGAALLTATSAVDGRAASTILDMAAGVAICAGLLLAIWFVAPQGMGFGDVRLAAVLGLYLGAVDLRLTIVALLLSSAFGTALGLALRISRRSSTRHFPFAPALALGAIAALCFAQPLLQLMSPA